ncbi:MAG: Hsp20/alpha crystallin family protein [Pseudomonadota bacterium]|nr:Hsp20/alpha crystallin family protein [Pseudomonadota bacterium]
MNQKQQNQQAQQSQQAQQNQQAQQAHQNQQGQQGQQGRQAGQPNSPAYQPGQTDSQTGQSSQDDRFGNYGGSGQGMPGQGQGGQDQGGQSQTQGQGGQMQGGQMQGGQTPGQGREVAAAGRQQGGVTRSQPTTTLLPPVDIYEDDSGFTVVADLPGVSKEQLVVRVNGDNLLIEGSASVPTAGNMELVYGEIQSPQYRRSFTLSRELDPGKIEAKLNNGVLRLRIPKAEEAKPRRIEVSIG